MVCCGVDMDSIVPLLCRALHRDTLQGTVEAQERDIEELKKSVYELSYMLSMQVNTHVLVFLPYSTLLSLRYAYSALLCSNAHCLTSGLPYVRTPVKMY